METSYPTSSTNSNGPAWQTGKVLKLSNMAKIPDHSNLKTGRLHGPVKVEVADR
jgi:hypothetical protein